MAKTLRTLGLVIVRLPPPLKALTPGDRIGTLKTEFRRLPLLDNDQKPERVDVEPREKTFRVVAHLTPPTYSDPWKFGYDVTFHNGGCRETVCADLGKKHGKPLTDAPHFVATQASVEPASAKGVCIYYDFRAMGV